MNELNYTSPSERISALLDGEIEQNETPQLFYELAANPELQDEMRDMIAMRRLMSKSMPFPPERLKTNILKSAGLLAATDKVGGELSSIKSKLHSFFSSRIITAIAAATVGSLLTAYFMGLVQPGQFIGGERSIAAKHGGSPNVEKPVVISAAGDDISKPQLHVSAPADIIALQTSEPESILPAMQVAEFSNAANSINGTAFQNPGFRNVMLAGGNSNFIFAQLSNKFILEMRAFSAMSFPNPNIKALTQPAMNNIGIALLYKINDEHYAGIEIGQENFLQSYKGVRDGHPVVYDQNYLGFWGALAYQYSPQIKELLGFLPFARVSIGATEVGPIGKSIIGLKYNLSDNFAIFTGAEGSILLYKYQNEYWTTRKIGATGGVSIKF